MKRGPAAIEITIATMPAIRTSTISGRPPSGLRRPARAPARARPYEQDAVAGLEQFARARPALRRGSRTSGRRMRARARRSRRPRRSPSSASARPTSRVALLGIGAELGHLAEDGDRAAAVRERDEVLEAGAHRDGVRVPRVVDSIPPPGERKLLVPPRGELDWRRSGRSRPRAFAVASAVSALVARCRAVKSTSSRPSDVSSTGGSKDRSVTSSPTRTTSRSVAVDREPCGDHGDAAGRERCDELTLRPGYALEVADLLQMHRADVRDHADVRLGERAELGDLAEAAHRQLEDAELGVRLDAADRQRDADLGVVAPLGGDGPALRLADRGEDVFRRGLAHRAGDRDEPARLRSRRAPASAASAANTSSGTSVAAAPRAKASLDEVGAAADRDEQVALLDPARVRLQARHLGGPRRCLELPRGELRDLGERERDHAVARSARSASPATARSSNGCTAPRLLAGLVPLACDHDDVARPGELDRAADRGAPVELDFRLAAPSLQAPPRRSRPDPRCAGCPR